MRFLAAALLLATPAFAQTPTPAASARAADQPDDSRRHGPEIVAFGGVKPGQTVVDLVPGGGYFTRLFSEAVGPRGHVYAVVPAQMAKVAAKGVAKFTATLADPAWKNVTLIQQPAEAFALPHKADLVFTSQNLHDYNDPFMAPATIATISQQVFAALKPGGVFLVVDHAAVAGSKLDDTDKGHRIDPAEARRLVEAAGFAFDGESPVLANPADAHLVNVFDSSIRGHTDQFVYRFRKPRR